ncbi:polyhydroxybutyrate depolymerase [Pycnococcus provasolii]
MPRYLGATWWCTLALLALPLACDDDVLAYDVVQMQVDGSANTIEVYTPTENVAAKVPVVIALHGLCMTGQWMVSPLGFDLIRFVDSYGFALVAPDAPTRNAPQPCVECGNPFYGGPSCLAFAAFPSCCARTTSGPGGDLNSSVAYLMTVRDELLSKVDIIDASRIFLFGFSNGGFMSYRLLCEFPHAFAGAMTLAASGPNVTNAEYCPTVQKQREGGWTPKVRIVHVHGEVDDVIKYNGGPFNGYPHIPAARDVAEFWAEYNDKANSSSPPSTAQTLDLLRPFTAITGPVTAPFPLTNEWFGSTTALASVQAERAASYLNLTDLAYRGGPLLRAYTSASNSQQPAQAFLRGILRHENETTVTHWSDDDGGEGFVELWVVRGQGHNLFQLLSPEKLMRAMWSRLILR